MAEVEFNAEVFWRRVSHFYSEWKQHRKESTSFKNVDGIVVVVGGQDDDQPLYLKSLALQTWLLDYEISEMLFVFSEKKLSIMGGSKTIKLLEPLANYEEKPSDIELDLVLRKKDTIVTTIKDMLLTLKASFDGQVMGKLTKESPIGTTAKGLTDALGEVSKEFSVINVAPALSLVLAYKDSSALHATRKAAGYSCHVMNHVVQKKLDNVVDEGAEVKHSVLADTIERHIQNPKKLGLRLTAHVDVCYTPIVQSGGTYNLKPSAQSNDDVLKPGTIICSLGSKFNHYCSNVGRTYMVDPPQEQENNYKFLLTVREKAVSLLQAGKVIKDFVEELCEFVKTERSDLADHFYLPCGFGMGIEFRDSGLVFNKNCARTIRPGSVYNLALGFDELEANGKKYALFLADTVYVPEGQDDDDGNDGDDDDDEKNNEKRKGSQTEILTSKCPADFGHVAYLSKGRNEEEEDEDDLDLEALQDNKVLMASKTRGKITEEDRRKEHQKSLAEKQRQRALEASAAAGKPKVTQTDPAKRVAYEHAERLPKTIAAIFVDSEQKVILVPIYGLLVPFQITTIKNITCDEEAGVFHLRIHFFVPGTTGQTVYPPSVNSPKSVFLRELDFRCKNGDTAQEIVKKVRELRKQIQQKEADARNKANTAQQARLELIRGKAPRLPDLSMRPTISGRKTTGALEAHVNGFRFTSLKRETIDIIYKNIKFAFFQPADNELIVCLVFHLKNEIMIGKKKIRDIQFYDEVMSVSDDLAKHRSSYGDEREQQEEARERKMRMEKNQLFKRFMAQASKSSGITVEVPFRQLGFYGVPHRSTVFVQPTPNCLVHLIEPPFFITVLDEVEFASLERVSFNLKNFDLIFVFKDYTREVARVDAIPSASLDAVKTWLNKMDIRYYESPLNFVWPQMLKMVVKDPQGFFDDGGWEGILAAESDGEDEDEEEEEPDFEAPSSSEEESSEDDYDSESSDSVDEEEFDEDEDESEYGASEEEDSEEEAERRARKRAAEVGGGNRNKRRR